MVRHTDDEIEKAASRFEDLADQLDPETAQVDDANDLRQIAIASELYARTRHYCLKTWRSLGRMVDRGTKLLRRWGFPVRLHGRTTVMMRSSS